MVNPEGTAASQIFGVGCPTSTQCVPFHCTITPTSGAAGSVGSLGGLGGDGPPPARTLAALTIVVRFPHSWMLTNTCVPPGPTASARGCLPKMGVGEKAGAPVAGSNAFTWSSPLTHTKARVGVPANTTSVGSSPSRKVAFTRMERRATTLPASEGGGADALIHGYIPPGFSCGCCRSSSYSHKSLLYHMLRLMARAGQPLERRGVLVAAKVGAVRFPEQRAHLGAIPLAAEAERVAAKRGRVEAATGHVAHRRLQRCFGRVGKQDPRLGRDRLERAASRERDRGAPAGERLQRRDAEILLVRLDQRAAAAVRLPQRFHRHPLLETNGGSRDRSKPAQIRTGADDPELRPHPVRRANREVHALVGDERRDGEKRSVRTGL